MLKLGTMVEYANQVGRIVARTIELQPKYDIMLANGTIRPNVREGDLIVRRQAELQSGRGALADSGNATLSMEQAEPGREERNADSDRRG